MCSSGATRCTMFTKFSAFVCIYKHFPSVGAFSHKFSIAPTSETTDRIKKVMGCKNGTDLLHSHAKYAWWGSVSRAGCRRKSVMFLFCLFFVTLWNDELYDNGNAMKRYNFQNDYMSLHRGSFVVVHLYSTFSVDPQNFLLGTNLYQKYHFRDSGGCKPTFFIHNGKIWHKVRTSDSLPRAKFGKNT